MNAVSFNEQPFEVRNAVETYELNGEWADQCLEALLSIVPEKEGAVRALLENYGEFLHVSLKAKETLGQHNLDAQDIMRLSYEYWELTHKK